jgi:hypothetical protein
MRRARYEVRLPVGRKEILAEFYRETLPRERILETEGLVEGMLEFI